MITANSATTTLILRVEGMIECRVELSQMLCELYNIRLSSQTMNFPDSSERARRYMTVAARTGTTQAQQEAAGCRRRPSPVQYSNRKQVDWLLKSYNEWKSEEEVEFEGRRALHLPVSTFQSPREGSIRSSLSGAIAKHGPQPSTPDLATATGPLVQKGTLTSTRFVPCFNARQERGFHVDVSTKDIPMPSCKVPTSTAVPSFLSWCLD